MAKAQKIAKSPIIDAVIQINCTFQVNQDAVVGLILGLLQANKIHIDKFDKLPISNIPEQIRKSDPNLKNSPIFRLQCGNYSIFTGLYGFSIGIILPYQNWAEFKEFTLQIFNILKETIIKGISAISIKYVNFFKSNIFDNINCNITLVDRKITNIPTIFRTEIQEDKHIKVLQISNGVHLRNIAQNIDADGSIIDISVLCKNVSIETVDDLLESAHTYAESMFFELLNEDYIKLLE